MGTWRACAGASKMVRGGKFERGQNIAVIFRKKEKYILQFSSGVLSQNDYLNLVQCETLEDLKLHLQSTDYGNFLASESSLQVT